MTDIHGQGSTGSENPSVDDLQHDIDQTREELAQTVEALAAKADVKGRTEDKAAEVGLQLKEKAAGVAAQARHVASNASAQANLAAIRGTQVAREKGAEAREKLPATLRDQPSVLLAAGGAAVIAGTTGLIWLVRRRRS